MRIKHVSQLKTAGHLNTPVSMIDNSSTTWTVVLYTTTWNTYYTFDIPICLSKVTLRNHSTTAKLLPFQGTFSVVRNDNTYWFSVTFQIAMLHHVPSSNCTWWNITNWNGTKFQQVLPRRTTGKGNEIPEVYDSILTWTVMLLYTNILNNYFWHTNQYVQSDIKPQHNSTSTIQGDIFSCEKW